jgi:glutaredoxin
MVDADTFADELDDAFQQVLSQPDPREVAEKIASEHDISTTDYIQFQSKMDAHGIPRETTKEMWQELKDDGVIDGADEIDQERMDPVDFGDIDPQKIQQLHLFTFENCEFCQKAKEQLAEHIEGGAITVQDIKNDDDAAELSADVNVEEVPSLYAEMESGYEKL